MSYSLNSLKGGLGFRVQGLGFRVQGLGFRVYLDPQSMYNNGLYGCYYGFSAIILHTLGV